MDEVTVREDGTAEMAYVGETPWHGLGKPLTALATPQLMLVEANLDWLVGKGRALAEIEGYPLFEMEGDFYTVRLDNGHRLGRVGTDYEVFQNERLFELFGDFKLETAGSLRGGEIVFGLARLDSVKVAGDTISRYLLGATGHDGKTKVRFKETNVRVVCKNTLDMATFGGGVEWTATHNEALEGGVDAIRAAVDEMTGRTRRIEEEIGRMVDQAVGDELVEKVLDDLFPKPPKKAISEKAWAVRGIYEQHPTVTDYKGTAWGLYNAISFYELWTRPILGDRLERQALDALAGDPTPKARDAHKKLVAVRA